MKHMEMCLSKSYDFVKQKRPCISPNLHFMGQLLEFEKQLQEASPNKDSPLFEESPLPMDVESIPVSISASSQQSLPIIRERKELNLKLPLKSSPITDRKQCFKRTIHSASAPSSIDIPNVPEAESSPSAAKVHRTSLELPSCNYRLFNVGQFYSSTDGILYLAKTAPLQTNSLPNTPVNSRVEPCLSGSCRTQQTFGSTKTMDSQFSPCRVVACNGGQYV